MILLPKMVSSCGRFVVGDVARGKYYSPAGGTIDRIDHLGSISFTEDPSEFWNPFDYVLVESGDE